MEPYPELRTARLILREFSLEDAPEVQRLVGEWEVARPLLIVPHPYEDGMAQEWIATHRPAYGAGERVTWAVALREEERSSVASRCTCTPYTTTQNWATGSANPTGDAGMPRKPPRR
jgi:RimJ/RimL family protein N-acetyltransferase